MRYHGKRRELNDAKHPREGNSWCQGRGEETFVRRKEIINYGLAVVRFSNGSAMLHGTVSSSTPRKVDVQVGDTSLR